MFGLASETPKHAVKDSIFLISISYSDLNYISFVCFEAIITRDQIIENVFYVVNKKQNWGLPYRSFIWQLG